MSNYLISLDQDRMERLSIPFYITYANGNEIDFNKEGIGVLVSVEVKDIPSFIENAIAEKGLQEEYAGYSFGPVTEGEKIWVEAGMVETFILDTITLLTKAEFFDIILQLAKKALEAVTIFHLKEKGLVDDVWISKVKAAIPQLEAKLKNIP